MRVLVYMGHPAHFHLYKNVIKGLKEDGNEVDVLIKKIWRNYFRTQVFHIITSCLKVAKIQP